MNSRITMAHSKFSMLRVAVPLAAAVVFAAPLGAGEPEGGKPPAATYGRTPDTVIPYRRFRQPYTRFFQSVMAFRGSGRDSAPSRTVRIGLLYPAGSAPDADLGQEMLEGVQLAVQQANADGGYRGTPFVLVPRADGATWGASSNEMVAFRHDDDVLAVIGSIDGANTHIALRVALKMEMPMVNTATTDPTLTETNIPWLIRCMADDRQQGYALAHHIFNECGIKRVAAFRSNDRYGRTGIAEFRDAARRLKHPLLVELRWERGDRDFTAQLDRIARTGAEAIVLWGNAIDTAAIVREIRRRGMTARLFGCDRLVSRRFVEEAGEAAEGVVAVASYNPLRDDPRLHSFTEAYRHRFHHAPGPFAAHAYDGAQILIAAIRQAGPNRVRIRDALFELTHYDGVTGPIEFDTTRNDIGPVYIATVQGGRFVYREARFTAAAQADSGRAPYRTLTQSPPAARSPARAAAGPPRAYRVGCFLPLDATGRAAVRGLEMALAEDAETHPGDVPIEVLVRDARGTWGDNATSLVDLVLSRDVIALIGSTERRGTHLAEMLAAKFHFPVLTLCATDPTVTKIPLPWIFRVAPAAGDVAAAFARRYRERYGREPDGDAASGYDAGVLVASQIRAGARDRLTLREQLAAGAQYGGARGPFRFDVLGNRTDPALNRHAPGIDGGGE